MNLYPSILSSFFTCKSIAFFANAMASSIAFSSFAYRRTAALLCVPDAEFGFISNSDAHAVVAIFNV